MRYTLLILAAASALAGCNTTANPASDKLRGLDPVNVPVVTRQDFVFDASAADGSIGSTDMARLDGWFQGLDLGYGDTIYVEGPYADAARGDVVRLAGRYGMMVTPGSPVLPGAIAPGSVRIVVSRARASVPNCPNWKSDGPNLEAHSSTNFGCGVNTNLAAMIANPEDLVHGREGTGINDSLTSGKAVSLYRSTVPTGAQGLKDISTKKGN